MYTLHVLTRLHLPGYVAGPGDVVTLQNLDAARAAVARGDAMWLPEQAKVPAPANNRAQQPPLNTDAAPAAKPRAR